MQAIRLAQLDARTSTIRALTGLSTKKVREIAHAISKRSPPKGRVVESLDRYIKNKKHRRHVSFLIQSYRSSIFFGMNHVEAFIESYILYQTTLLPHADARSFVDIDHAFHIIQETNKKIDYDLFDCTCCKHKFFYYKYELPIICPFCTDKKEIGQSAHKLPSTTKKVA